MRTRRRSVLLILALQVGVTWGQWRADGKVIPDTASRKAAGSFGAMLLVTDEPSKFFEQWNRPASPDYKPNITTVAEAHRGGQVAAVVIFQGCKPDKSGNCNVDVDYQLLRPDGSVYGGQKDVALWKARPAPPEPNLQLGLGVLGLKVEADDPLGTYTFEAKVRDRNAKVELVLKQELKVVQQAQDP